MVIRLLEVAEVLVAKLRGLFHNAKTVRDIPAGALIFEAESSGTEMFGVMEGEVEVRLRNGAARRLGVGDTFGEMAIVDSSPRSGTALAVTDAKLAVIDRSTFLFLVHETPTFALQVMSSLAERLRSSEQPGSLLGGTSDVPGVPLAEPAGGAADGRAASRAPVVDAQLTELADLLTRSAVLVEQVSAELGADSTTAG